MSLTAKTRGFQKGMRRASNQLKSFGSGIVRITAKVGALGAGLTALAGGGGLALLVRSSFKSIDSLAKMSDRIGIATEKLGALQHAAAITGSDTETLNKSMVFLAKALGEAKQGIGEGKQALEALGLSVDDFLGQTPDEQVRKIADAFGGLATQEEKAFIASKLFGRAGTSLINLLDQGRSGIDALEKDFKRLGGGFSRLSAALIEQGNDAITRLQQAFRIGAGNLAIAMAPFVEAAANAFTEATISGNKFRDDMIGNANGIAKAFDTVLTTIRLSKVEMDSMGADVKGSAGGTKAFLRGLTGGVMGFLAGGGIEGAAAGFEGFFKGTQADRKEMRDIFNAKRASEKDRAGIEDRHGSIDRLFNRILADAQNRAANALGSKPSGLPDVQDLPALFGGGSTKSRATEFKEISLDRVGLGGTGGVQNNILKSLKSAEEIARETLQFLKSQNQFLPVTV